MADIAFSPATFIGETWDNARTGLIPATVGALGAVVGLSVLTPVLAPASVPMSVLGIVLGRHSRNLGAITLGAVGLAFALSALIESPAFWLLFAALFGSVSPG